MNFIIPPSNHVDSQDEPLYRYQYEEGMFGTSFMRGTQLMTSTGNHCIFLPWHFWWVKRLKCTVFELGLFLAAWGCCMGIVLGLLKHFHATTGYAALSLYAVFHFLSAVFAIMIYEERITPGSFINLMVPRAIRMLLIFIFIPIAGYIFANIGLIHSGLRTQWAWPL